MHRTLRTLLLSAIALGVLATAALAAAPGSPGGGATGAMAGMHATGAAPMGTGDLVAMHAGDMTTMHASMTSDPAMQAHMAEHGADADCPMDATMATMHRESGHDYHHTTGR